VAGRPGRFLVPFFLGVFTGFWYRISKPRGSANFRPGSNPNLEAIIQIIQANSVHSTPPINTSANNIVNASNGL
jgi:hypothetical protein